jgi:hypothetical protein
MLLLETTNLLSEEVFIALQQHLFRLGIWAIASVVIGVLAILKKWKEPFWQHLSLQFITWGLIDGIIVLFGFFDKKRLDFLAFVKLKEFLWLNEGLNISYIAVGVTLVLVARSLTNSPRLLGAGIAVTIQGFILFTLDTILIWKLPEVSKWLNN